LGLHILSLSCLILPLLTVKNSVSNGTLYPSNIFLVPLASPDCFLESKICYMSLLDVIVNAVLDNPPTDDAMIPVEVVQGDFVQGKVRVNVMTEVMCI